MHFPEKNVSRNFIGFFSCILGAWCDGKKMEKIEVNKEIGSNGEKNSQVIPYISSAVSRLPDSNEKKNGDPQHIHIGTHVSMFNNRFYTAYLHLNGEQEKEKRNKIQKK